MQTSSRSAVTSPPGRLPATAPRLQNIPLLPAAQHAQLTRTAVVQGGYADLAALLAGADYSSLEQRVSATLK